MSVLPKNKEELVQELLGVRARLEAQGKLTPTVTATTANTADNDVTSPAATSVPLRVNPTPPPAPFDTNLTPSATEHPAAAPVGASDPYREAITDDTPSERPSAPTAPYVPEPHIAEARMSDAPPTETAPDALLMREDVTDGLRQLLSTWDIFAKSGILGFGPGGMEHPTYQKIAALPTSAVLAGQWDGADKKVATEIGEYVAGWEKEREITPEEDESFELYLRRVIASYLSADVAPANDK